MATPTLDIPMTAPNVLQSMDQTHVCLEITPGDDARLAYNLAVPKAWGYSAEFGPVAHGLLRPQGIGFLAGAMHPHAPVIAVTRTPVPFEVPIDAWTLESLTTEGWQVVRAQWFPGPNGLFYDVTAERVVNEVQEVRRSSVRNLGSDIITVNCLCAREWWEGAKEIFWTAHATFKLLATRQTRMETWAEGQAEKEPKFAVAYPLSWSAEEAEGDAANSSGIHLRLVDAKGETLLAYLQARLTKRAPGVAVNVAQLQSTSLTKLERAGVRVTTPLSPLSADDDPRAIAVKGWLGGFQGAGQLGTSEVRLRVGYLDREGHEAAFVMISPQLTDDRLTALRAQRAFEIARATLTLTRTDDAPKAP